MSSVELVMFETISRANRASTYAIRTCLLSSFLLSLPWQQQKKLLPPRARGCVYTILLDDEVRQAKKLEASKLIFGRKMGTWRSKTRETDTENAEPANIRHSTINDCKDH